MTRQLVQTLRGFQKQPAFTAAVVVTLALGFGSVHAIFMVVHAALVQPPPYPDPHRLVILDSTLLPDGIEQGGVSVPDVDAWRENSASLAHVAVASDETLVLTGFDHPQRVAGVRVSPDFFAVFGVRPELGTQPPNGEIPPDGVVVSHSFFRDRWGGDPRRVDSTLVLDHRPYQVLGVMPQAMDFPRGAELWLALAVDPEIHLREARYLRAVGRLRPGVTPEQAGVELSALARRLEAEHPETNRGIGVAVTPLHDRLVGTLREPLLLLLAGVGVLLLLVCGNVASLLLARGSARGHELDIRLALGASRGTLGRELMFESLVLSVLGGVAGVGLGVLGARLFLTLYPEEIPGAAGLEVSPAVVGFAIVLTLAVGLLVGLLVAGRVVRGADTRRLAEAAGRHSSGRGVVVSQGSILVAQTAVTLVLVVGAALLLQSLVRILSVDPGFRGAGVLTARVVLPSDRYADETSRRAFFQHLLERLQAHPRVASTGAVTNLPLSGTNMRFGIKPGGPGGEAGEPVQASYRAVTPGYFQTLGVPLVDGRLFGERDLAGAPPVAIVNRTFAQRHWPGGDAVGRDVWLTYKDDGPRRIVGVTGDIRHSGYSEEVQPEIFVPYAQHPWPFLNLVLRTDGDPLALAPLVRAEVAALDVSQPVDRVQALDELVAASVARPRFLTALLVTLAVLAVLVAVVGVYGLSGYWVGLRLPEARIRLALGATPRRLVALLVRRPLVLALVGVGLGAVGALLAGRLLEGWLFGVAPTDTATFAAAGALVLLSAATASLIAARNASRTDAALVLRGE
jgi:putative ABC transport system permease protein